MKFAIITHVSHKIKGHEIFAYEPYVREMNCWENYVDEIILVAPLNLQKLTDIDLPYSHQYIDFRRVPEFHFLNVTAVIKSLFILPKTVYAIYQAMRQANHIHLRCPGNMGLLGCFVQIVFPNKPKTAKYAGNWDPKAKQPWSYRLQKWLLSNTFLTKNIKVLVYGEWPNQSKNIVPFFTASYSEGEIVDNYRHPEPVIPNLFRDLMRLASKVDCYTALADAETSLPTGRQVQYEGILNFIFVGALTIGKQPLLSVEVIQKLKEKCHKVHLDIYGEGLERSKLESFIKKYHLEQQVILHGNALKETIKVAFQQAHFLLFISASEGWPKVVTEAMFWGCLPITSKVSCIPYMLANGERGALVNANADEIVAVIEGYLQHPEKYVEQTKRAMEWSRQFTMEKFEEEIGKLLG